MGHTTVVSPIDTFKEEIHCHISVNSWLNIIDLNNWVIGIADDADQAEAWHNANSSPKPNYWKSWEVGSAAAAQIKEYFHNIGLPTRDDGYTPAGEATVLYAYKCGL